MASKRGVLSCPSRSTSRPMKAALSPGRSTRPSCEAAGSEARRCTTDLCPARVAAWAGGDGEPSPGARRSHPGGADRMATTSHAGVGHQTPSPVGEARSWASSLSLLLSSMPRRRSVTSPQAGASHAGHPGWAEVKRYVAQAERLRTMQMKRVDRSASGRQRGGDCLQ